MSRPRKGWRSAERTYRHLSAVLARKARDEVTSNRLELAATVCPDAACPDPLCIAARAAIMRGADWKVAFDIVNGGAA